jgi:hypothetical protein
MGVLATVGAEEKMASQGMPEVQRSRAKENLFSVEVLKQQGKQGENQENMDSEIMSRKEEGECCLQFLIGQIKLGTRGGGLYILPDSWSIGGRASADDSSHPS